MFGLLLHNLDLHEVKNGGLAACENPKAVEEDGDELRDNYDTEDGQGQLVVVVDNTRFRII